MRMGPKGAIVTVVIIGGPPSVESAIAAGSAVTKALLALTVKSSGPVSDAYRRVSRRGRNGRAWSPSQRAKFARTLAMKQKDKSSVSG